MSIFLIVVGVLLLVAAVVLPWINLSSIGGLQKKIVALETRILYLDTELKQQTSIDTDGARPPPAERSSPVPRIAAKPETPTPKKPEAPPAATPKTEELPKSADLEGFIGIDAKTAAGVSAKPKIELEQLFGGRILIWIGGVALAFAGVFLVKYSIDNNLLKPNIRVLLGGLFGGALLFGGDWVRRRPDIAAGTRIAQALTGAGVAVLYASVFAAASLYALISPLLATAGMGAITILAVILSLRHGHPIALIGLVGGFLAPALVGSTDPSAPLLFGYLYIVFIGFMFFVRWRNWWLLAVVAVLGVFAWTGFWVVSSFAPPDALWLALFLLGVSGAVVLTSIRVLQEDATDFYSIFKSGAGAGFSVPAVVNVLAISGAILLLGIVVAEARFGFLEWSLFGLLAVGVIALSYFNDRLYGFAPWVSSLTSGVMLLTWRTPDDSAFALALAFFALIHVGAGYMLMWRSRHPIFWAALISATQIGFYLLAFFKLHGSGFGDSIHLFWGMLAFALAAISVHVVLQVREHAGSHPQRDLLLALFSATGTAFVSIGFAIELDQDFFALALVGEIAALAWINNRIAIKALRGFAAVLTGVFGVLVAPDLIDLVRRTDFGFGQVDARSSEDFVGLSTIVLQFALPAAGFAAASYWLRLKQDGRFVQLLEGVAVALTAIAGYLLIRWIFAVDRSDLLGGGDFLERGLSTNFFFVLGLTCLALGHRLDRIAVLRSGVALCALAIGRIILFDFLIENPAISVQTIDGWVVFNTLLLPFGFPMIWVLRMNGALPAVLKGRWEIFLSAFAFCLAFALVSLNVRFFFQGPVLVSDAMSDAETYTYSVAWLLLGVGLLALGFLRQNPLFRYASLGVMILTISKVFLYDAAELEGLFRVFSFLGLGLSVLGVGWFYSRFLFRVGPANPSE